MSARASSLPMLRHCGSAGGWPGAGRAASMGTAFHARAAGGAEAGALLARLSPEELSEVQSWHVPTDFAIEGGYLTYAEATKEQSMAMTEEGRAVPIDDPLALLTGHPDMYWVRGKTAYIGDIKKSRWTATEGADSLQLHAYGMMVCAATGCASYQCGLWIASEGFWLWGEMVDYFSERAVELWGVIVASAKASPDEYSTGSHCSNCYGRLQCPAWLVRSPDGWKPPGTEDPEPDHDTVLRLLLEGKREMDLAKAKIAYAEEWARRNPLLDGKGKAFRAVQMQGRKSASVKELEEAGLTQYVREGAPFEQWRWVLAEPKTKASKKAKKAS